jgi:curved DNA-binding protein CbpA
MNYYEVLAINREATLDEIKRAFRRKTKESHPDKWLSLNLSEKEVRVKKEEWDLLQRAYETLKDPKKRATYDVRGETQTSSNFTNSELIESLLSETRSHQFAIIGLSKLESLLDRVSTEREYLEQVIESLKFSVSFLKRREVLYREISAFVALDESEKAIVEEEIKICVYGQSFLENERKQIKIKIKAFDSADSDLGITDWDRLIGKLDLPNLLGRSGE